MRSISPTLKRICPIFSDLKVTESFARGNGEIEKADHIRQWFEKFEKLLKMVLENDSLKLAFSGY